MVAGIVPLVLCVPFDPAAVRPVIERIPDLKRAADAAAAWQAYGAGSTWSEVWGSVHGLPRDRMAELRRYQAAAGEKLALACTTGVQAALWLHERADEDPVDPAREMAHRAVAEMQAYFLLSAGHDLVNITARILALDTDLHAALRDAAGSSFEPGSTERAAYLSLNKYDVADLAKAARGAARWPTLRDVVEPVRTLLGNAAWARMAADRDIVFHRQRTPSGGKAQDPGGGWEEADEDTRMLTLRAPTLGEARAAAYTADLQRVLGPVATAFEQLEARLDAAKAQIAA